MYEANARIGHPNLRHLRVFSLVVRDGNISKAAAAANVTQSAASQAIGRLERRYGCRLLTRGPSGAHPTTLGRVAAHRIDRALEMLYVATRRLCAPRGYSEAESNAIQRMLSASQLAAFSAATRAGGFKAGARLLGISQPSVHRAVRQLQEIIGIQLVESTSQGVTPTRAGAAFARSITLAIREIDLIADDLDEARGQHRGRVKIGSLALGRSELVPRAVARVVEQFPNADFLIQDGTYEQLLRDLCSGDLDLIVNAARPLYAEDITTIHLFNDKLAIVARAGHPLAADVVRSPDDLARYPWIVPRAGTPTRSRCDEFLRKIGGVRSGGLVETGAMVSVRGLLLESDRLTLLSRRQITADLEAGLLAAIDVPLAAPGRSIVATVRKDWKPTQVQAAVLEELKNITREWAEADGGPSVPIDGKGAQAVR